MIYLDSSATTLQKPARVSAAMAHAVGACANPGRSGHQPAMEAASVVFDCRCALGRMFGVEDEPWRVVLTLNCTHALNLALKSTMARGGHAVISGYEHNSVVRPLEAMGSRGVSYTAAYSPLFDPDGAVEAIEAAIRPDTRCVVVCHVSNVFGFVLPLERIDALCARRGIALIVDAAQSAGVVPLDVGRLKAVDFVCMAGHKELYGPQGTGALICCRDEGLESLMEGGTGSHSLETRQPQFLPDVFESGTPNVPGIAGLLEGVLFVEGQGILALQSHSRRLAAQLHQGLARLPGVRDFYWAAHQAGVLSFTVDGMAPEAVAARLDEAGICVRAGLHCAPLAHRSAGTLPSGTVRASFSAFNTSQEVAQTLAVLERICAQGR